MQLITCVAERAWVGWVAVSRKNTFGAATAAAAAAAAAAGCGAAAAGALNST